jgi:alpha-beta hydrolase superfamily lysophospholipase
MLEEATLHTPDGFSLYAWLRRPPGVPRGVIAHVHGMGEHSRRYDHLSAYWAAHGYGSAGFDLRGHGRSQGQRGHAPSYERLMEDIGIFLERVGSEWPGAPAFLYGHSLGGNLVLNYVIRRRPALAGVVATGPYLRLAFEPPAWKVRLAEAMKRIVPALSQDTGLDVSALSRDPEVVRRYQADPLVHARITASFFTAVHAAGEAAIARATELAIPALLMHGSADRITSLAGSQAFVSAAGGRARLEMFEGAFHEIHNEPGWERMAACALQWLENHAAR